MSFVPSSTAGNNTSEPRGNLPGTPASNAEVATESELSHAQDGRPSAAATANNYAGHSSNLLAGTSTADRIDHPSDLVVGTLTIDQANSPSASLDPLSQDAPAGTLPTVSTTDKTDDEVVGVSSALYLLLHSNTDFLATASQQVKDGHLSTTVKAVLADHNPTALVSQADQGLTPATSTSATSTPATLTADASTPAVLTTATSAATASTTTQARLSAMVAPSSNNNNDEDDDDDVVEIPVPPVAASNPTGSRSKKDRMKAWLKGALNNPACHPCDMDKVECNINLGGRTACFQCAHLKRSCYCKLIFLSFVSILLIHHFTLVPVIELGDSSDDDAPATDAETTDAHLAESNQEGSATDSVVEVVSDGENMGKSEENQEQNFEGESEDEDDQQVIAGKLNK
jgi:hypothetical protein